MHWIMENLSTLLISAVLLAVIALIVYRMVKNKKKGASPCGCHCGSCPAGGVCHGEDSENRPREK